MKKWCPYFAAGMELKPLPNAGSFNHISTFYLLKRIDPFPSFFSYNLRCLFFDWPREFFGGYILDISTSSWRHSGLTMAGIGAFGDLWSKARKNTFPKSPKAACSEMLCLQRLYMYLIILQTRFNQKKKYLISFSVGTEHFRRCVQPETALTWISAKYENRDLCLWPGIKTVKLICSYVQPLWSWSGGTYRGHSCVRPQTPRKRLNQPTLCSSPSSVQIYNIVNHTHKTQKTYSS